MLFHRDHPARCADCLYAAPGEGENLQCAKRGEVSPENKCLRFRYDPCKRIPPRPKAIDFGKYEEEDYSL